MDQALDGSGLLYDVGAGHFNRPATARFCAFSRSENRTKLEFNQHCMDSMTSLRYFTAHARWPIHIPANTVSNITFVKVPFFVIHG